MGPHGFPYEGKPWGTFCRGGALLRPLVRISPEAWAEQSSAPYRVRLLPKSLFRDIGFCVYG